MIDIYNRIKFIRLSIRNINKDNNNFDWDVFKFLCSVSNSEINRKLFREMNNYCFDRLETIGEGGSRRVYIYNTLKVLKVAINEFGMEQNSVEASISRESSLCCKIYEVGKDNLWLLSELVRPLRDENEFEEITGIEFDLYRDNVISGRSKDVFTNKVILFSKKHNLNIYDLVELRNLGVGSDRRLVLLDVGYSKFSEY
jgi:hypothetical protein